MNRHFPEIEPVRQDLERTKWVWVACCVSPLVYLLLAHWIRKQWFLEKGQQGLLRLDPEGRSVLAIAFLVALVSLEAVIVVLRRHFARQLAASRDAGIKMLMETYRKRMLVLAAVSETAALLGFAYFLLVGDFRSLFVGGVAAFFYYAQSYPSEQGLATYLAGE